jgi:anti-sigma B factor antagonist
VTAVSTLGNGEGDHAPARGEPVAGEARRAGPMVITLRGEQDVSVAADLQEMLALATLGGRGDLVVDLTAVSFVDLAIVRALTRSREVLNIQSRDLFVRGPSATVSRALELCGLLDAAEPEPAPRRRATPPTPSSTSPAR